LELDIDTIHCASVCVYHNMVETVANSVDGTPVGTCAVSTGFPAGHIPHQQKLEQIQASVAAGADEIDIVVSRASVLAGDWQALYDEVKDFRTACGPAHLKTILATGELASLKQVAQASHVCMMAGADFIKTSTGKETTNATLPVGIVMARAIRDYYERTGQKVGFKPAGGISKAKVAVAWLAMMKEELGEEWMRPNLFRIGASSLLGDIERQLEFHLSGHYSAANRHPMA
jgi:deoxyribose-phosphate aldolase